MVYKAIKLEKKDGIAIVILNRPYELNAVTQDMRVEILEILDHIEKDRDSKIVVFTAFGKAFSVGQDIEELKKNEQDPEAKQIANEYIFRVPQRIFHFEKPMIGAINGVAAGDGAQWALAFDLNVASENARFGWIATALGLV
jgi:2-(1,2-epoxy-1,2-dihydrophenyl)acetyl-CoA isomerase